LLGRPATKFSTWSISWCVPLSPATHALRFDRAYLVIEAAIQGLGVALESARLSEAALQEGDLVPVFLDRKRILVHAHHLVYPEAHGKWNKVVRFVTWLRREAAVQASAPKTRSRGR
jgi:LysR family glycine cleavage system transcriptional activator